MIIKTLSNKDAEWPKELNRCDPGCVKLYMRGDMPSGPRVGVIGTRRPTAYGRLVVDQIVPSLARAGVPIVSGLAIGVDSLAHQATLDAGGQTIAVLPGGVNNVYPRRHAQLADRISQNGCVVSEKAESSSIQKHDFIARNRIIAAMSDLLIVVEANIKSGTMHTVRYALEYNQEVGAVPGQISTIYSSGTNQLLKDGAHVITGVEDVFGLIGLNPDQQTAHHKLTKAELQVHKHLQSGPRSSGDLSAQLDATTPELLGILTELEIKKVIARTNDGLYSLR